MGARLEAVTLPPVLLQKLGAALTCGGTAGASDSATGAATFAGAFVATCGPLAFAGGVGSGGADAASAAADALGPGGGTSFNPVCFAASLGSTCEELFAAVGATGDFVFLRGSLVPCSALAPSWSSGLSCKRRLVPLTGCGFGGVASESAVVALENTAGDIGLNKGTYIRHMRTRTHAHAHAHSNRT